jgi:hypothetical protein
MLKRLAIAVVVVLGAFFWKLDVFPQERELVWSLPSGDFDSIEIQLWSAENALLKREEQFFEGPSPSEVRQTVSVRSGTYLAKVFLRKREGEEVPPVVRTLQLGSENVEIISLR